MKSRATRGTKENRQRQDLRVGTAAVGRRQVQQGQDGHQPRRGAKCYKGEVITGHDGAPRASKEIRLAGGGTATGSSRLRRRRRDHGRAREQGKSMGKRRGGGVGEGRGHPANPTTTWGCLGLLRAVWAASRLVCSLELPAVSLPKKRCERRLQPLHSLRGWRWRCHLRPPSLFPPPILRRRPTQSSVHFPRTSQ